MPTKGGVVDVVGAGERPGVGRRGPRSFRHASCFHAMTGLLRAAARAADMNLRALVIAST